MKLNIISVKQLRENFSSFKKAIERGENYILIYRSKPLAEIRPFKGKVEQEKNIDEKVKKVRRLAGGVKLGIKDSPKRLKKIFKAGYEKKVLS